MSYGYSDGMPRSNRYPGTCTDCGAQVPARSGRLLYLGRDTGRRRYAVVCGDCQVTRARHDAAMRDDTLAYYGSAEAADRFAPSGW